jgi:hypothetical protein
MTSVFGIPCQKAPNLGDIYFSTGLFPITNFLKSIVRNPDASMTKHEQFFYSKMFLTMYLFYIVFRIPRELSLFLKTSIGLNYSIVLLVNMLFVFELLRRYGYECTIFLVILLYIVYNLVVYMIPILARSPVGEVLPELKEIPAATRKPGVNHCRRLVVCRATPVFDNHIFQRGKHEKCLECAKINEKIIFKGTNKGCESTKRDIDAKSCYECTEGNEPDYGNCSYDQTDCENVNMVLDLLEEKSLLKTDKTEACKEGHGSLCWFGKIPGTDEYRGWKWESTTGVQDIRIDPNDRASIGLGFPTQEICMATMEKYQSKSSKTPIPEDTCVKGVCDVSDKRAECACSEYADAAQFLNPCEFLEKHCDEKSIAYTEAQLKLKQADVNVDDIISVGNVDNFLNDLDKIASSLP